MSLCPHCLPRRDPRGPERGVFHNPAKGLSELRRWGWGRVPSPFQHPKPWPRPQPPRTRTRKLWFQVMAKSGSTGCSLHLLLLCRLVLQPGLLTPHRPTTGQGLSSHDLLFVSTLLRQHPLLSVTTPSPSPSCNSPNCHWPCRKHQTSAWPCPALSGRCLTLKALCFTDAIL